MPPATSIQNRVGLSSCAVTPIKNGGHRERDLIAVTRNAHAIPNRSDIKGTSFKSGPSGQNSPQKSTKNTCFLPHSTKTDGFQPAIPPFPSVYTPTLFRFPGRQADSSTYSPTFVGHLPSENTAENGTPACAPRFLWEAWKARISNMRLFVAQLHIPNL
jgi:hypothetical protein